MKYLIHSEIDENSIILIEFEDGRKEPYFVKQKEVGSITGATMLLGFKLVDLLENSKIPYPVSDVWTDRLYISNEKVKGKHVGIKGYRKLNPEEKTEWTVKLQRSERLKPLLEVISKN
ncbi:MAG: hypothetical protein WC603_02870 [Candidatus Paceibacterota bacterium]|jgi:hypothetical protein